MVGHSKTRNRKIMKQTSKEQAKLCIEVYGNKDSAIAVVKREINFRQINGTTLGVRYWNEVKTEIEKL
jgi:hypothetical protein